MNGAAASLVPPNHPAPSVAKVHACDVGVGGRGDRESAVAAGPVVQRRAGSTALSRALTESFGAAGGVVSAGAGPERLRAAW